MAMRNITSKFERFRVEYLNRKSTKRPFSSTSSSSSQPLSGPLLDHPVHRDSLDSSSSSHSITVPPEWVSTVDTFNKDLHLVKDSIKTLKELHAARVNVSFDDSKVAQQESDIENLTGIITTQLRKCEGNVKRIAGHQSTAAHLSAQEKIVRVNVMRALASELQSQSKIFRQMQKDFLHNLNDVESQEKGLGFGNDEGKSRFDEESLDEDLDEEGRQRLVAMEQQASDREREIIRVAQSVHELASIFNELNVLVIEQGSILDRIDYNLEQTNNTVKKGKNELIEADKWSKKGLTCKCLVVLFLIFAILLTILIVKKR